jgi:hypothetical protein
MMMTTMRSASTLSSVAINNNTQPAAYNKLYSNTIRSYVTPTWAVNMPIKTINVRLSNRIIMFMIIAVQMH